LIGVKNVQTKRLVSVALALALFFVLLPIVNAQYYGGLGTHNLEQGVNEPLTVETDRAYQFYVARLDNTGNINMTIKIKTDIKFIGTNGSTIQNPNQTKISFVGKKEYTSEPVEYPFFLMPDMQLQVWLNTTLTEPGNYTFSFETDSEPQIPAGYTGSLSVSNGKFNAKLMAITPPPYDYTPILIGLLGGIVGVQILTVQYFRKKSKRKRLK